MTLLLTAAASGVVAVMVDLRDRVRFDNAVRRTETQIRQRLQAHIAMLRSGDGFIAASDVVDQDEFAMFVAHVGIDRDYPGAQGIGYALRLPATGIRDLEEDMRAQGMREFRVHPREPARADYFPIVFLEPLDVRNRAALGYDMFSDSVRREAMERARDTGEAAMTGAVRLVQELDDSVPQAGFLIYQPVYRDGVLPESVAEKRRLLQGFVYSPFRADDMFNALFSDGPAPVVAFRVHDGATTDSTSLLHDSRPPRLVRGIRPTYSMTDTLLIAGRSWTVQYETLPAFQRGSVQPFVPLLALSGVLVSLLMYRMTRAQVSARAKAERSEQARSRFFAAMSHELRTPINAIIGYNDLLLSGVYGPLPPAQAHGIERSQIAAKHLVELVNDVLDLSKIEAGKLRLEFDTVDVGATIADLLATIRPLAEERNCTLEVMPCACTTHVQTDPRRLRQILLNLLSNATKFGAGHPIMVRCGNGGPGEVWVEVSDHGRGIAPADLDRIFDEFVQLDHASMEGTGLGLAISRKLAELLGGRLEVRSTEGKGSTFRLRLPEKRPKGVG